MSTLLLRLAAPIQSWGLSAKFDVRDTQLMPTKSGVIGLLACALGRRREEDVTDLNVLRMGVRADQEGRMMRDFHIARPPRKPPYVTTRYYLNDAVFVVGLEGEEALLETVAAALKTPAFPLYLGRRSCPPDGKLVLGIRAGLGLQDALRHEPWQARAWYQARHQNLGSLPLLLEVAPDAPSAFFQQDEVISFAPSRRMHGYRSLRSSSLPLHLLTKAISADSDSTLHDAMMDWGE